MLLFTVYDVYALMRSHQMIRDHCLLYGIVFNSLAVECNVVLMTILTDPCTTAKMHQLLPSIWLR